MHQTESAITVDHFGHHASDGDTRQGMITIVPCRGEYLFQVLANDPHARHLRQAFEVCGYEHLENSPFAFAGLLANGRPLLCAGVTLYWENRAEAWAIIDHTISRRYFLELHKKVKHFLDTVEIRRIELAVECDYVEGHRWAKALGFKLEAERLEAYGIAGTDHSLYAKIKREGPWQPTLV